MIGAFFRIATAEAEVKRPAAATAPVSIVEWNIVKTKECKIVFEMNERQTKKLEWLRM